jgi:putative FmdB family regulatory protein
LAARLLLDSAVLAITLSMERRFEMPIYEYQCPKCGRFDVLQKMSDDPVTIHDSCGSPVTKLISAAAFSFKGSGFYVTDYARKGAGDAEKAEKSEKKDPPKSEACASCDKSGDCKAA